MATPADFFRLYNLDGILDGSHKGTRGLLRIVGGGVKSFFGGGPGTYASAQNKCRVNAIEGEGGQASSKTD